jgi:hypothetical protein
VADWKLVLLRRRRRRDRDLARLIEEEGAHAETYERGYQAGRAETVVRVESVLRLISPDDITPTGLRQVRRVLVDLAAAEDEEE